MSANIGWLFYKNYFQDINYNNLTDKQNETIIQDKVQNIINQTPTIQNQNDENMLGNMHFQATTTYPGLLLGSGNAHELPSIEGQAILGFHFDYTSGLPIIQGSSIKGVLRSAFKHQEYIKELLNNIDININELEKEIFDNGDIFFDAEIIESDNFNKILADDYLAPHGDNPFKNPIPLRFIKVLPNIIFRFDFELFDGIISKESKSKLFQNILEDLGLGAKTNVGYGKFNNFRKTQTQAEEELEELEHKKRIEEAKEAEALKIQAQKEAKLKAELDKKQRLENEKIAKEQEAKAKLEALASMGIESIIKDQIKYKALENVIKKYIQTKSLNEAEKEILENHILNNMNDKIKRKKFPFGTFGNEKCLGKHRANNLADKLGL